MLNEKQCKAIRELEQQVNMQEYYLSIVQAMANNVYDNAEKAVQCADNPNDIVSKAYELASRWEESEPFINVICDYLCNIKKSNAELIKVFDVLFDAMREEQSVCND